MPVVSLIAKRPGDGRLSIQAGACTLSELDVGHITALMAYDKAEKSLSEAVKAAHGMALPAVNRATGTAAARAIWTGRGQVMLFGPAADPGLAQYSAMSDQSDAWTVVALTGPESDAVLARLTPLDIAAMKRGHTARSTLQHMTASITRTGVKSFQIMVFRSMAQTLLHDLEVAMKSVAAQAETG